jgi:hypothetical protein
MWHCNCHSQKQNKLENLTIKKVSATLSFTKTKQIRKFNNKKGASTLVIPTSKVE